jgi:hypothetical protein
MFEADPEGEIEQVALWGMYRMQFEPHHVEDAVAPIPPLAVATDVITVMESVFRPDSYVAADGQKRYVIRGLKLRPAIERDAVLVRFLSLSVCSVYLYFSKTKTKKQKKVPINV